MTTKEIQLKADALHASVLACAALAEELALELEAHESNLASVLKRIVDVSGDAAFLERDLFHDAVAALSGSVAGIPTTKLPNNKSIESHKQAAEWLPFTDTDRLDFLGMNAVVLSFSLGEWLLDLSDHDDYSSALRASIDELMRRHYR